MLLRGMHWPLLMAEEPGTPGGGVDTPPADALPAGSDALSPGGSTVLADGSTGYTTLDWRSQLDPEYQAKPWLKDMQDVASVVKRADDLLAYQGRSIGVPGKDAKPEDWDRVYDRLGRPKTPEAYEIESPVGTEGAAWWNPEVETALKGVAHKAGLNNQQAAVMVRELAGFLAAGSNRQEASKVEQTAATQRALSELWGGSKVNNLRLAQEAVRRFGDGETDLWAFFEETGLGNHIGFIKFLHRVGALLPEDNYVGDGLGPLPTISELESQIEEANTAIFDALSKGGGKALEVAQAKMKGLEQQKAAQLQRMAEQAQRRVA